MFYLSLTTDNVGELSLVIMKEKNYIRCICCK